MTINLLDIDSYIQILKKYDTINYWLRKKKEMHYTNSTVTDIDCLDDNINSNIPTSW